MGLICIGFFPYFMLIVFFVFSSGCVYSCSHLPCTFDEWVSILDFYIQGFSSKKQGREVMQPCKTLFINTL
jgi:hypothetical protein